MEQELDFSSYNKFLARNEINPATITRKIASIKGFYRFLKSNQDITVLSGKDLSILQHFLKFGQTISTSQVYFDENDKICVTSGPLKGLEGFDPKLAYPETKGMRYMKNPVTGKDSTQMEMGKISNLITDMLFCQQS